jgi:GGDEF domain-containing protein
LTDELIEIAARDTVRSPETQKRLEEERSRRGAFYSDLIYSLCNVRYEEHEARLLWVNLLAHKTEMSDRLGRNVGVRVAALDYFKNIVGLLDDVKIVGGADYIETELLAVTDGLTGLFNHRYLQDRLERAVARAAELGAPLSLLMIDIDYFKQYNDLNGHIAGDVALRELGQAVDGSVRVGEVRGSLWRTVEVRDIEFDDADGRLVLAASRVQASFSLVDLVRGRYAFRRV